jgi:hypothetical protein
LFANKTIEQEINYEIQRKDIMVDGKTATTVISLSGRM